MDEEAKPVKLKTHYLSHRIGIFLALLTLLASGLLFIAIFVPDFFVKHR